MKSTGFLELHLAAAQIVDLLAPLGTVLSFASPEINLETLLAPIWLPHYFPSVLLRSVTYLLYSFTFWCLLLIINELPLLFSFKSHPPSISTHFPQIWLYKGHISELTFCYYFFNPKLLQLEEHTQDGLESTLENLSSLMEMLGSFLTFNSYRQFNSREQSRIILCKTLAIGPFPVQYRPFWSIATPFKCNKPMYERTVLSISESSLV